MTSKARTLLRAMAALLGLIGACCLLATLAMLIGWVGFSRPGSNDVLDYIGMAGILIVALATAFYFFYVAYLAWFKLSPTAVNYVCGTYAFFIWTTASSFFTHTQGAPPSVFLGKALLGFLGMVVIYYAYRAVTGYFMRQIFERNLAVQA